MQKEIWTAADVRNLFRIRDRYKSRTTLLNAEQKGEIPCARRVKRGKQQVRAWSLQQLPEIGKRFGFLSPPSEQKIICCYTAKGGVLKTTLSYTLGRILALNGIKTLLVGLDFQCSLTDLAIPRKPVDNLNELENEPPDLLTFYQGQATVDEIIKPTTVPTLDIIPESPSLIVLERAMAAENRRECMFERQLIPHLKHYEVIIFDTSPNWGLLIANALVTSDTVLSPVGCDVGTYRSLRVSLNTVRDFEGAMELSWDNFFLIPTLRDNTKISQDIFKAYLAQYSEYALPISIRRTAKGQESVATNQTVLEYCPTAPLAADYFDLLIQLWSRITEENAIEVVA